MPDLGPTRLFICWQAIVLAVIVASLVEAIKRIIDNRMSKERREASKGARISLPGLPLALGALLAIVIPLRPEWLTTYVEKLPSGRTTSFAAWGAVVGQFSGFMYAWVKQALKKVAPSVSLTQTPPPPSPSTPPSN